MDELKPLTLAEKLEVLVNQLTKETGIAVSTLTIETAKHQTDCGVFLTIDSIRISYS